MELWERLLTGSSVQSKDNTGCGDVRFVLVGLWSPPTAIWKTQSTLHITGFLRRLDSSIPTTRRVDSSCAAKSSNHYRSDNTGKGRYHRPAMGDFLQDRLSTVEDRVLEIHFICQRIGRCFRRERRWNDASNKTISTTGERNQAPTLSTNIPQPHGSASRVPYLLSVTSHHSAKSVV